MYDINTHTHTRTRPGRVPCDYSRTPVSRFHLLSVSSFPERQDLFFFGCPKSPQNHAAKPRGAQSAVCKRMSYGGACWMGTAVICPSPLSRGPGASLDLCAFIPLAFLMVAKQLLVCFRRWSSKAQRRKEIH